jgi:hypothetical protein
LGYGGVEYFMVRTSEGNGVLHVFWAWRGGRVFWVDQRWLSCTWQEIHGAPVVWISAVGAGRSPGRAVGYVVSHYVAGQKQLVRVSWSWRRGLGFPLGLVWSWWKRRWPRGRVRERLSAWGEFLRGGIVALPNGWEVSLASVRSGWRPWAAMGYG